MGNIVDKAPRAPKLKGFRDSELYPPIEEALKALARAEEARAKAVENIEGQYLRALENAHDGENAACKAVKAQLAAIRKLF